MSMLDQRPPYEVAGATDAELVAGANSDAEAFAELYRRYVDPIYWFCLGRLRDPTLAEDATAEVFTKAFAALPRFQVRGGGFRAWLFSIAYHAVVDAVRARLARASFAETAETAELVDTALTPEASAIAGEGRRALWTALARLPLNQRQVVELRLAGLTGAEIAAMLGRTQGAVDTAQSRAVARLRELLQPLPLRSDMRPNHSETIEGGRHA